MVARGARGDAWSEVKWTSVSGGEMGGRPTARMRLLTPAGDLGPEAEFMAMCPATVTVHAARVRFAAMRQRGAMVLEAVRAMAQPHS